MLSMFAPMPIHNNMNMTSIPNMNLVGSVPNSFGQLNAIASSSLNNINQIRALGLSLPTLNPTEQLSFLNNMQQQMNAISSPHTQARGFQSQPIQNSGPAWSTSSLSLTPAANQRFLASTPPANLTTMIPMASTSSLAPAQARTITSSTSTPANHGPQIMNSSAPFYSNSLSNTLGVVSSNPQIPLAPLSSQAVFAQPAISHVWQSNLEPPVSPNTSSGSWERQPSQNPNIYVDSPATSFGHLDKSTTSREGPVNAYMEAGEDTDDDSTGQHLMEKRTSTRRNSSSLDHLLRTVKSSLARMDEIIAKPEVENEYSTALSEIRSALSNAVAKVTNATVNAGTPNSLKKRKSVDEDPNTSPSKRGRSDDEEEEEHKSLSEGEFDEEDEERGQNACKPCPLLEGVSKKPIKVLFVNVQRQYTVSKRETLRMTKEERERLIPVHVRIMGNALKRQLYFVAKDVCLLIHTRKGNVAKSIGQFKEDEKVRMSVVCPRSNGTISTHILTALTLKGVKRLLTSSRSPLAPLVHKWILKQVEELFQEAERIESRRQLKKREKSSLSAPVSQTTSPTTASKSLERLPVVSSEHRNGSSNSGQSTMHLSNSPFRTSGPSLSPASHSYPSSPTRCLTMNTSSATASVNAKLVALAQMNDGQNVNPNFLSVNPEEFSTPTSLSYSAASSIPITSLVSTTRSTGSHMLDSHEIAKDLDSNSLDVEKQLAFINEKSDLPSDIHTSESSSASLTTLLEAIKVRSDKSGTVVPQHA